jgi:fumarate hydratase class I
VRAAYEELNLRYSQLAPLSLFEETNTGTNLPAQIDIGLDSAPGYELLFMAKGGGSANKSFLYQETKAILDEKRMLDFLAEKISSLGTAACPPYHLAVVIGGTTAEHAHKTAKLASAHHLDDLPATGDPDTGHGIRDRDFEQTVFELTQGLGFGAQFGGKYFCHDVRVIRLRSAAPRIASWWRGSMRRACSSSSWSTTRRASSPRRAPRRRSRRAMSP